MICKVLELKKLNDLSVTGTGTGTGTVVHAPIHYNSFDTVRLFSSGQTPLPVRSPPNLHRTVGEAEEQAARLALLAVHVQRVHGQAAGHLQRAAELHGTHVPDVRGAAIARRERGAAGGLQ